MYCQWMLLFSLLIYPRSLRTLAPCIVYCPLVGYFVHCCSVVRACACTCYYVHNLISPVLTNLFQGPRLCRACILVNLSQSWVVQIQPVVSLALCTAKGIGLDICFLLRSCVKLRKYCEAGGEFATDFSLNGYAGTEDIDVSAREPSRAQTAR